MRRASYRTAVAWIALNDGAGDSDALEVEPVSMMLTVTLVADLFDVEEWKVAADVVRYRREHEREHE